MQLLAASQVSATDTFLHPGYISAYPRPLEGYAYPTTTPELQLEVAGALQLKGETLAASFPREPSDVAAGAQASRSSATGVFVAVLGLLLAISASYLLRDRLRPHLTRRRLVGASGLAFAGAAVALLSCGGKLPDTPPWTGVAKQEYVQPDAATRVILHGIVADAIINLGQPIESLANIKNEVGLPVKQLTAGEAYALKTYGIDGWGREMRLTRQGDKYTVTSAGPDGSFATADDIKLTVRPCSEESWDSARWAFFVTELEARPVVFFHRWTGEMFKYKNRDAARAATGGDLFDFLRASEVTADVSQVYQQAAAGLTRKPLVLRVFPRSW